MWSALEYPSAPVPTYVGLHLVAGRDESSGRVWTLLRWSDGENGPLTSGTNFGIEQRDLWSHASPQGSGKGIVMNFCTCMHMKCWHTVGLTCRNKVIRWLAACLKTPADADAHYFSTTEEALVEEASKSVEQLTFRESEIRLTGSLTTDKDMTKTWQRLLGSGWKIFLNMTIWRSLNSFSRLCLAFSTEPPVHLIKEFDSFSRSCLAFSIEPPVYLIKEFNNTVIFPNDTQEI